MVKSSDPREQTFELRLPPSKFGWLLYVNKILITP